MSVSGALFDLAKLNDVSKNVISVMSAETVLDRVLTWAEEYNKDFYDLLTADKDKALRILSVDRGGKKPRKDIAKWSEVPDFVAYLYDDLYKEDFDQLPENVTPADAAAILEAYTNVYDKNDDQSEWFGKVKSLCEPSATRRTSRSGSRTRPPSRAMSATCPPSSGWPLPAGPTRRTSVPSCRSLAKRNAYIASRRQQTTIRGEPNGRENYERARSALELHPRLH